VDDRPFFMEDAPARPTYPETPGYRRRDTSKAAAASVAPKVGLLRDRVLAAIKKRPSTADEIAVKLGETVLGVRPRTTELAKLEKIRDSGERRPNASGRMAIVWAAV
jgi:hypothetical protein